MTTLEEFTETYNPMHERLLALMPPEPRYGWNQKFDPHISGQPIMIMKPPSFMARQSGISLKRAMEEYYAAISVDNSLMSQFDGDIVLDKA